MKRGIVIGVCAMLPLALYAQFGVASEVCSHPVAFRSLAGEGDGIGGSGAPLPVTAEPAGDAPQPVRKGGIGGTGHAAEDAATGIGGTGIIGTITGFASICVNGLEVHYANDVAVSENGRPAAAENLAVGQLVSIDAQTSARGLEARHIRVVHALEGPVTQLGEGRIEVMGAPVLVASAQSRAAVARLQVGGWVQVSGHYGDAGAVRASRINRVEPRSEVTVVGPVERAGAVGAVVVDVSVPSGEVLVRGTWDGQKLAVRESRQSPAVDWTQRPNRLVIETRVRDSGNGRVRSGRSEVDALLQAQSDNVRPGELVRVTARVDAEGGLQPERVESGRDEPSSRDGGASGDDRTTDERHGKSGKARGDAEKAAEESAKAFEKEAKAAEKADKAAEKQARDAEKTMKAEKADKMAKPEKADKSIGERSGGGERGDRSRSGRGERSGRDR